jgi:hypothetical protein
VAAVGLFATRRRPVLPEAEPELATPAMAESARVVIAENDWERALHWTRRLALAEPENPMFTLGLGLAWHNHAWGGSRYGRARSATRTSLDRIEMELRALALIDSAVNRARTTEEWARAGRWYGQTYENLGLPLDALEIYQRIRQEHPGYQPILPRVAFLMQSLRDPVNTPLHPGTDEENLE